MAILHDPKLRRFWFPVPARFGIGVTAYPLVEAQALARAAAADLEWPLDASSVIEDIDLRGLDQGHVVTNIRPPNFRGVWYPPGSVS